MFFYIKTLTLIPEGGFMVILFIFIRVRVKERISSPPGHVISQGVAPRARVVTCRGGGSGGGGHKSLIGAGVSKF